MTEAPAAAGAIGYAVGGTPGESAAPGALALKEWAAVAHALLDGRQTVLLRKGGIHEKRFTVAGPRFLLFPTVAHSHAESTRPEHAELLELGRGDVGADQLVLRVDVEVVAAVAVARPDRIAELEQFHIWTTESVRQNRIDFRPRHQLAALVVSAKPVRPAPIVLPLRPDYAGCRSWIDLQDVPSNWSAGEPVHDRRFLLEVARQVRTAVG